MDRREEINVCTIRKLVLPPSTSCGWVVIRGTRGQVAQSECRQPVRAQGEQRVAGVGPDAGKIAFARVELPTDTGFEETRTIGQEVRDLSPQLDGV